MDTRFSSEMPTAGAPFIDDIINVLIEAVFVKKSPAFTRVLIP